MSNESTPSTEIAGTSDAVPATVTPVKTSRGRTALVVTLIVLGGLFSFLAVPITFIHGEVLNTNRYVASVAPLNYNPEVANALSTQLTNELFQRYDVEKLVQAAPELSSAQAWTGAIR